MREIVLNGNEFEFKEEIHDYLQSVMSFPEYYGRNLSALYDVLTDVCEDTRIVLKLGNTDNEEVMDYLEKIAEVLSDAAEENMYLEFVLEEI